MRMPAARLLLITLCLLTPRLATAGGVRIATFEADVTPPLGSPVAYVPARSITDPLSARGIVLLTQDQQPVVLCAVDFLGIANEAYDLWRERLAKAAGTTVERVSVHCLHQHDAPRCDFTSAKLLERYRPGFAKTRYDLAFARSAIERVADAITESLPAAVPVTHVGTGAAKVERVASNRRILGEDGKVAIVRYSRSVNPAAIDAPEGLIDPLLRCVSFWNGDNPIASLTYYATHPQSYYGQGDVTSEFVGLARAQRESEAPAVAHIHFTGAAGNVAAGKYNRGTPEDREALTERLHAAMRKAFRSTTTVPLSADDIEWRVTSVRLPLGKHLQQEPLVATLTSDSANSAERLTAAKHLAWLQRTESGRTIDCSALRLGNAYLLQMPGELFVEYQLAAQAKRPGDFVALAAYGQYGPGYICTDIAYQQGGYEASDRASRVGPGVEQVLMDALNELLADSKP